MSTDRSPSTSAGYADLCDGIRQVHRVCQGQAAAAVDQALTLRNWLIGAYIVEYEQHGRDRAEYGEKLLERLARDLGRELGRGLGLRMLRDMRRFYLTYPQLGDPIRHSRRSTGSLPATPQSGNHRLPNLPSILPSSTRGSSGKFRGRTSLSYCDAMIRSNAPSTRSRRSRTSGLCANRKTDTQGLAGQELK